MHAPATHGLTALVSACLFCVNGIATAAESDPGNDVRDALLNLQAILTPAEEDPDPVVRQDVKNCRSSLDRLARHVDRGEWAAALTQAEAILQYAKSDRVDLPAAALKDLLAARIQSGRAGVLARGQALATNALGLLTTQLTETTVQEQLEAVAALLNELGAMGWDTPEGQALRQDLNALQGFLRTWTEYAAALDAGDAARAAQVLMNLIGNRTFPKAIPITGLRTLQTNLADRVSRDLDRTLADLATRLRKAATPEELQPLRNELEQVYQTYSRASFLEHRRQEIEAGRRMLGQWMNVLALETGGQFRNALQVLRNMENETYNVSTLVPLALVQQKKTAIAQRILDEAPSAEAEAARTSIDALLSGARDADALAAARSRLTKLLEAGAVPASMENDARTLQNELQVLESAARQIAGGQPHALFSMDFRYARGAHPWAATLETIRKDLWRQAVRAACTVEGFTIGDEETGEAALERTAREAHAAGDWPRLQAVLEAYQRICAAYGRLPSWVTEAQQGCKLYLAGRNYEKAGELDTAVQSYRQVLALTGPLVPIDAAAARLQELRGKPPAAAVER